MKNQYFFLFEANIWVFFIITGPIRTKPDVRYMKYFLYSINHTLPVLGGYGDQHKGHQKGKTWAIIYSHAICKPETTFKKCSSLGTIWAPKYTPSWTHSCKKLKNRLGKSDFIEIWSFWAKIGGCCIGRRQMSLVDFFMFHQH